jgi:tetratricopeptide (TPR) repeat protein
LTIFGILKLRKAVLALNILMCLADPLAAQDVNPSEREFAAWPRWCQELFVTTDTGRKTPFVARIPSDIALRTRGNPQLNGFWHYCAGIIWLDRARAERDEGRAAFMYRKTIDEVSFNYALTASDHPLRGEMGTLLGLAYRGLGEHEKALEFLEKALKEEPDYAPAYTATYLVLRDAGRYNEARETLLRGNEAARGESAELHYFLGLAYIEAGDVASARKHANQAYKLGYPLPGLRNKLERLEAGARGKTE